MEATDAQSMTPTKRGIQMARRIEETLSIIRRARTHAHSAAPSASMVSARKQLKKLRAVLEVIQRDTISEGLSTEGVNHLTEELDTIERRLEDFLVLRATKSALKTLATEMKAARKKLAS